MDQNFKTSFIPKKPITTAPSGVFKKKSGINFFNLIAIIVFLIAVLGTAGVFVYKSVLQKTVNSQREELLAVVKSFDNDFVDEASRLSQRILASRKILDEHVAVTELFAFLGKNTLQTVQFNSLNYQYGKDGVITIQAPGKGDTFNSIVLQSDHFGSVRESGNRALSNVLFDGVQRANNDAQFNFKAVLNSAVILYSKTISGSSNTNQDRTNTPDTATSTEEIDVSVFEDADTEVDTENSNVEAEIPNIFDR